jgi:hypothetical protein
MLINGHLINAVAINGSSAPTTTPLSSRSRVDYGDLLETRCGVSHGDLLETRCEVVGGSMPVVELSARCRIVYSDYATLSARCGIVYGGITDISARRSIVYAIDTPVQLSAHCSIVYGQLQDQAGHVQTGTFTLRTTHG